MTDISLPLTLSLAIAGCASHTGETKMPLIVNYAVQSAYSDYQSIMQETRIPVAFDSGEVAVNCKQYLRQKKSSAVSESTGNFLAAQDYVTNTSAR